MTTQTVLDTSQSARPRRPITAHPWFPAVVGLWFAALFGLCSLAVPPAMLERAVTMLGIDKLFAAAQPPLGQTARLLVALGLSSVGEITGLLLGRWLGSRQAEGGVKRQRTVGQPLAGAEDRRARDVHPDAPPRKPLSASADLGLDGALRRRALASEHEPDHLPFIESAPLPGSEHPARETVFELLDEADEDVSAPHAPNPPPIDQSEQVMIARPGLGAGLDPEHPAEPLLPATAAADPAPFAPPLAIDAPQFAAPQPATEKSFDVAAAPLETLGVVQLSERLALAMQARRERLAQRAAASAQPMLATVPGMHPLPDEALLPTAPVQGASPDPVAVGEIDNVAEAAAPAPLASGEGEVSGPIDRPAGGEASSPVVPLLRLPSILSGIEPLLDGDDDHEDDLPALARSLSVPAGPFSRPGAVVEGAQAGPTDTDLEAQDDPDLARGLEILARRTAPPAEADACADLNVDEVEEETAAEQEGYSSLLSIGGPFHREPPVRIEIEDSAGEPEPVVVFPGHGAPARAAATAPFASPFAASDRAGAPFAAPSTAAGIAADPILRGPAADPAEAERALKAALASLQRISGAR